jgi:hypothetical protein
VALSYKIKSSPYLIWAYWCSLHEHDFGQKIFLGPFNRMAQISALVGSYTLWAATIINNNLITNLMWATIPVTLKTRIEFS